MYWRSAVCSSDRPETKFHLADIHISIGGRPALGPGRPAQARGGVEPPGAEPARDKQQDAEPEKPAFHALAPWWPIEATSSRARVRTASPSRGPTSCHPRDPKSVV